MTKSYTMRLEVESVTKGMESSGATSVTTYVQSLIDEHNAGNTTVTSTDKVTQATKTSKKVALNTTHSDHSGLSKSQLDIRKTKLGF